MSYPGMYCTISRLFGDGKMARRLDVIFVILRYKSAALSRRCVTPWHGQWLEPSVIGWMGPLAFRVEQQRDLEFEGFFKLGFVLL